MSSTYNITTNKHIGKCPKTCLYILNCKSTKNYNSKCQLYFLRYRIWKILPKIKCPHKKALICGKCWCKIKGCQVWEWNRNDDGKTEIMQKKILKEKKELKRIKKEQEIIQQCIEQQMKYHANNQW